jgi:hypothetical protein
MQTIQVRPSRYPRWQKQGGWEVFEAEGVCPVYCDPTAREDALSYARQIFADRNSGAQPWLERCGDSSARGQARTGVRQERRG